MDGGSVMWVIDLVSDPELHPGVQIEFSMEAPNPEEGENGQEDQRNRGMDSQPVRQCSPV